jgi:hypothetical protein
VRTDCRAGDIRTVRGGPAAGGIWTTVSKGAYSYAVVAAISDDPSLKDQLTMSLKMLILPNGDKVRVLASNGSGRWSARILTDPMHKLVGRVVWLSCSGLGPKLH